MERLSIDVTAGEHRQMETLAALQNKTLQEYARERLLQPLDASLVGEDDAAWQAFSALMGERMAEADDDAISDRSFDEIFESALPFCASVATPSRFQRARLWRHGATRCARDEA